MEGVKIIVEVVMFFAFIGMVLVVLTPTKFKNKKR